MKKTECEKFICESIYDFIREKWDDIDRDKCDLLDITKEKFLREIKRDFETAIWVMDWGMNKNYTKEMMENVGDDCDFSVFKLGGKYIKCKTNKDYSHTVSFTNPKTKTVIYF